MLEMLTYLVLSNLNLNLYIGVSMGVDRSKNVVQYDVLIGTQHILNVNFSISYYCFS